MTFLEWSQGCPEHMIKEMVEIDGLLFAGQVEHAKSRLLDIEADGFSTWHCNAGIVASQLNAVAT